MLSCYQGVVRKPLLTQDSASGSVLYTKEQVTLKCKIMEDSEGWTYLWYKGQDKTPRTNTGSHFNLSSVVPADSGEYRCQAERAGFKSEYSDSLSLEIKGTSFLVYSFSYVCVTYNGLFSCVSCVLCSRVPSS